jgi:hypothetical protein
MSAQAIEVCSKFLFGSSILLIIYIVYFEVKSARIRAEKAEIELGENDNENTVKSLTPDQLLDLVNSQPSSSSTKSDSNPKKPTS